MSKAKFINHKMNNQVETVEDMRELSAEDRQDLIDNYAMVSPCYYASQKATKEFYADEAKESGNV